jgi:hypothetical protein
MQAAQATSSFQRVPANRNKAEAKIKEMSQIAAEYLRQITTEDNSDLLNTHYPMRNWTAIKPVPFQGANVPSESEAA